jgi:hypothetical protein
MKNTSQVRAWVMRIGFLTGYVLGMWLFVDKTVRPGDSGDRKNCKG